MQQLILSLKNIIVIIETICIQNIKRVCTFLPFSFDLFCVYYCYILANNT